MPISLTLRHDGHVLFVQIVDPWDTAALKKLLADTRNHLDHVSCKVHTLVDVSQVKAIPRGPLQGILGDMNLSHPNRGVVIMVGASSAMRALARVVFSMVHFGQGQFYETEEEAWAHIEALLASEASPRTPAE